MPSQQLADKLNATIDCKQGAVRAVRFNVDGNYILTGGSDKSLKLWNPHKGLLLKTYTGHGYEVLDADGACDNAQLCSCSMDKTVIVWDVATGQALRRYRGHAGRVNCVRFNEDSSVVVSGSIDGTIRCWDNRSRAADPIQTLDEAKDSVMALHVTDHEIVSGSVDCRLRRYDLRAGSLNSDYIGEPVTSVSLTRDGQCVLVSTLDNTLKLMDKNSGEMLNEYKGHKNSSYKVDSLVSPSDTHVYSGSEDGSVIIWDLIECKQRARLYHNTTSAVHSLTFHPEDAVLVTACETQMFIWKATAK